MHNRCIIGVKSSNITAKSLFSLKNVENRSKIVEYRPEIVKNCCKSVEKRRNIFGNQRNIVKKRLKIIENCFKILNNRQNIVGNHSNIVENRRNIVENPRKPVKNRCKIVAESL